MITYDAKAVPFRGGAVRAPRMRILNTDEGRDAVRSVLRPIYSGKSESAARGTRVCGSPAVRNA